MRFLIGLKKDECVECEKTHWVRKYLELETKHYEKYGDIKYWATYYQCGNNKDRCYATPEMFFKGISQIIKKIKKLERKYPNGKSRN